MMPRLHPESNENRHKRTAQQIGPPCHGGVVFHEFVPLESLVISCFQKKVFFYMHAVE
jgi:hypothetical protein